MNIKAGLDYGTRLIKAVPKLKFNQYTVGYVHTDGQISFASQDAALNYAKNRVIKALNCDKPFERGILIDKNVVCAEINGNTSRVIIPYKNAKGKNIISVHGHPDAIKVREGHHPCYLRDLLFCSKIKGKIKKNGITYPVSLSDYRNFMLKPNEWKSIVYNSKGEYSMLRKSKSQLSMNYQEFNELENEYYMTVPNHNSFLSKLKYIYNSFRNFFLSAENAEKSMLKEANSLSNNIHEFLTKNTEQYGVIYETNYSNLIKK